MRRLLRSAVTALAVVSLAACGSADPATEDTAAVEAGSQSLTADQVTSLVADSLREHGNVLMTLSGTSDGEPVDGTVAVSGVGDSADVDITTVDDGEEMRMLLVGDSFYLRFGDDELEPGKPWAQVDLSSEDPFTQMMTMVADTFRGLADPTQLALTGATGELVSATEEGDATVHTVEVDMQQAMQELDLKEYLSALGGQAGQLAALAPELSGDLSTVEGLADADVEKVRASLVQAFEGVTSTIRVKVGSDGLPVSVTNELEGDEAGAMSVTIDYSGWGTTTVEAPPAAEVAPMPDLTGIGG